MQNILKKIVENKKKELELKLKHTDPEILEKLTAIESVEPSRFGEYVLNPQTGTIGLIAEVKLKSPSGGNLAGTTSVVERVRQYESGGADAISVVTDKLFFNGDVNLVKQIKSAVKLPVLQKDFIIDFHQIYEAKQVGTDALLLIAKILDPDTLSWFVDLCLKIGIEPIVEVNTAKELEQASSTRTRFIGVNSRNLETLEVDKRTAFDLCTKIPNDRICIGFSGMNTRQDVEKYQQVGAKAVLIGTVLMKSKTIVETIKQLKGVT